MNSRDRDLKKLHDYIRSLGLSIHYKPYKKDGGAAEYVTDSHITIYTDKRSSKDYIILSILHELGHHIDYLETGWKYSGVDEALAMLMAGSKDIPRKYRSVILKVERAGISKMSKIHRQLKLEIPFWKVKYQQEIDLFHYKILYHKGRVPNRDEVRDLKRERKPFYKEKYGRR